MALTDAALEVFAPAKINLTLHVTGQRADGYHLLDSLVVFAPNAADRLWLKVAEDTSLQVTGRFAKGVPDDARNLCWQAATLFGQPIAMTLEKHLPHAAGIGSGSSDAAAVLRGMAELYGSAFTGGTTVLGADVPVCLTPRAQRMQGIGERLTPVNLPELHAVLVNPRVEVPTGPIFAGLDRKDNAPMTPMGADFRAWLLEQRNDLEPAARAMAPVIETVLKALKQQGAWMARMSGSGATCVGLFESSDTAEAAAGRLAEEHPGWWVTASALV